MDKDMLYWSPASRHQAKPFLVQPCTASNFLQCKCAIKVAACPLARQRYGDMGARRLSQPNLWVVPRASMPWTALKKFGILSAQRARIGIKPFIPASQKTHSLFRLVSPAHTSRQRQTRWRRLLFCFFFTENVRAKGSSNSPGLLHIFTSSQFLIYSYLHKSSSYLHILSSPHLHISSSYLQICTGHLHIFISSLHQMYTIIFTSSHHSSHLHIFLHIFSASHLRMSSSHLHISSSHLHICAYHPHMFPHLLSLSPSLSLSLSFYLLLSPSLSFSVLLSPSLSFSLLLSPSRSLFFSVFFFLSSLFRRGAVPPRRHDMQPFRTKWGSICKNCGKIAS